MKLFHYLMVKVFLVVKIWVMMEVDFEDSDMANDFGGDEEVPEFNPDEESDEEDLIWI